MDLASIAIALLVISLMACNCCVGFPSEASSPSALVQRWSFDQSAQQAAFQAFDHHKTGEIYSVSAPESGPDSLVKAIRLRTGSLRRRGLGFEEFSLPPGCVLGDNTSPLQRIVLVYERFGKSSDPWFEPYLAQSGYTLASPVVGMFAYNASNLSSSSAFPKLSVVATEQNISIAIVNSSSSLTMSFSCAYFEDDRISVTISKREVTTPLCIPNRLGLFALVSPTPPSSPPALVISQNGAGGGVKAWKIGVSSGVGVVITIALAIVFTSVYLKRKRRFRLAAMEERAERGETLQTASVGVARAPAAGSIRTKPVLEKEYAANS